MNWLEKRGKNIYCTLSHWQILKITISLNELTLSFLGILFLLIWSEKWHLKKKEKEKRKKILFSSKRKRWIARQVTKPRDQKKYQHPFQLLGYFDPFRFCYWCIFLDFEDQENIDQYIIHNGLPLYFLCNLSRFHLLNHILTSFHYIHNLFSKSNFI